MLSEEDYRFRLKTTRTISMRMTFDHNTVGHANVQIDIPFKVRTIRIISVYAYFNTGVGLEAPDAACMISGNIAGPMRDLAITRHKEYYFVDIHNASGNDSFSQLSGNFTFQLMGLSGFPLQCANPANGFDVNLVMIIEFSQ